MAKKSETVKTTLRFVDLTQYRSAKELAALPLSKLVEARDSQEAQAAKNETMGERACEVVSMLKAGAFIEAEVAGKHRRFLMRQGASVFHVKPAVIDALARRGFLLGVPSPAKRKGKALTVEGAQAICGTT